MASNHVAYLGAFVVQGVLWRGGLLLDDETGVYTADSLFMLEDGHAEPMLHRLEAKTEREAVREALMAVLATFQQHGYDPKFMTVIHWPPEMADQVNMPMTAFAPTSAMLQ